ncbi:hypothetical protein SNEBB_010355 [Seison nebaliae]|nr:hypothetical protein SNEBB_010355 [Seison nebaliae]
MDVLDEIKKAFNLNEITEIEPKIIEEAKSVSKFKIDSKWVGVADGHEGIINVSSFLQENPPVMNIKTSMQWSQLNIVLIIINSMLLVLIIVFLAVILILRSKYKKLLTKFK